MSDEEMSMDASSNEMSEDEYSDDQVGQYDSETEEEQSVPEYGNENEKK